MTQVSLPQAGDGVGDSGPYTSDDWAQFFEVVFTGDQAATQGVLRNYLNELEVTAAANTISIDTGAGFCYGHWLLNDASVDINANACAGVETRWDRVVLVQNETAVAYNTNLLWPGAYAAGVPLNSCRIAILRGICGSPGVLPALLTGPNYYMTELARYQVTGGAVGTVTDYRDYCNFSTEIGADWIENRTRNFFVPALIGFSPPDIVLTPEYDEMGSGRYGTYLLMADDENSDGQGRCMLPPDYLSDITVKAVLGGAGSGNVSYAMDVRLAGCGERMDFFRYAETGLALTPMEDHYLKYTCTPTLDFSLSVEAEDLLLFTFQRFGAGGQDTVNDAIYHYGFIVEYTADS